MDVLTDESFYHKLLIKPKDENENENKSKLSGYDTYKIVGGVNFDR